MKTKLNTYNQAICDFMEKGRMIPSLDKLLLRGTGNDQQDLVEGWSDLDFSIIVHRLDSSNILALQEFVSKLKASYNFKISVTVVTSSDFNSSWHYHGMKALYYSQEIKSDVELDQFDALSLPSYFKDNLLLYDCMVNLAYLIHDLRNRYFSLGKSYGEQSNFTRHLVKRSRFIFRNAFFIMDQKISSHISREKVTQYFPKLTDGFFDYIKNAKYNWSLLIQDREELLYVMTHCFDQVNYIYEKALGRIKLVKQEPVSYV